MKLIHCADLHLDSRMRFLPPGKARERNAELRNTFSRMIQYAADNGVKGIIIAGDLFDTKNVSQAARDIVTSAICGSPGIEFYYLRGNHDADSFLAGLSPLPPNLRLFGDEWTGYELGRTVITGAEMTGGHGRLCSSLRLDPERINIVVLHGQAVENSPQNPEDIDIRELRGKGIDYLALGHVHARREEKFDGRGRWCCPGCLEGRGFDEAGEKGFMLLDIDETSGTVSSEFVPFARRRLSELEVDITGLDGQSAVTDAVRSSASGLNPDDLLHIILTGETDPDFELNLTQLEKDFEDSFYFVRVSDRSRPRIDYSAFEHDLSLRGEFVRTVRARDNLSEEDKAAIIRYGFKALADGEVIE